MGPQRHPLLPLPNTLLVLSFFFYETPNRHCQEHTGLVVTRSFNNEVTLNAIFGGSLTLFKCAIYIYSMLNLLKLNSLNLLGTLE